MKGIVLLLRLFFIHIITMSIAFLTFKSHTTGILKIRHHITKHYLTTYIHIVGKRTGAEDFISDGIDEYEKRLGPIMNVETIFYKSDEDLVVGVTAANQKYKIICLDEKGTEYTSRDFSKMLYQSFQDSGVRVGFVIGGFSGLPPILRERFNDKLISLSKMTWTHQMARLLLIEQIYRASEIAKGSKYHKD